MTKKMEIDNNEELVAKTSKRLSDVEEDIEARVTETLLTEPAETPEEIAELEAIPDEDESNTENPKVDFSLKDGPMKNLHINHINANENREKNK